MKDFLIGITFFILIIGIWHSLVPATRELIRVFISENKDLVIKTVIGVSILFCLLVVSV